MSVQTNFFLITKGLQGLKFYLRGVRPTIDRNQYISNSSLFYLNLKLPIFSSSNSMPLSRHNIHMRTLLHLPSTFPFDTDPYYKFLHRLVLVSIQFVGLFSNWLLLRKSFRIWAAPRTMGSLSMRQCNDHVAPKGKARERSKGTNRTMHANILKLPASLPPIPTHTTSAIDYQHKSQHLAFDQLNTIESN